MPPDVTEKELAILLSLWEYGRATIRQLADRLYPGGEASKYATVQKLLERLEGKKCVRRDRQPWPHIFEAAIDRETLIGWRLRRTAEDLCGGSLTPLLLHLLRAESLSETERNELRSFLDKLRHESPPNASDP
jgi:predicted transcriptional regulator